MWLGVLSTVIFRSLNKNLNFSQRILGLIVVREGDIPSPILFGIHSLKIKPTWFFFFLNRSLKPWRRAMAFLLKCIGCTWWSLNLQAEWPSALGTPNHFLSNERFLLPWSERWKLKKRTRSYIYLTFTRGSPSHVRSLLVHHISTWLDERESWSTTWSGLDGWRVLRDEWRVSPYVGSAGGLFHILAQPS